MNTTKRMLGVLILCCSSQLFAGSTGIFITDYYKYSGKWTRYNSFTDAQNKQNPLAQGNYYDKDLSLYIVSSKEEKQAIIMNSWWYTTASNTNGLAKDDPSGDNYYSGLDNPAYTGTGAMEIYDNFGQSISDVNITFTNSSLIGSEIIWNDCSLSIQGQNIPGQFALGDCGLGDCQTGRFINYDLNITAEGIFGSSELFGDLIESLNHPTSGTGTFTGIFQLTNPSGSALPGYYLIEWYLVEFTQLGLDTRQQCPEWRFPGQLIFRGRWIQASPFLPVPVEIS